MHVFVLYKYFKLLLLLLNYYPILVFVQCNACCCEVTFLFLLNQPNNGEIRIKYCDHEIMQKYWALIWLWKK